MGVCSAKWCLLGLLLVVSGLAQVSATDSAPTQNECRVHVEAALKQYWSHSPEEEGQSQAPPRDQKEEASTLPEDESDSDEEDQPAATEPPKEILQQETEQDADQSDSDEEPSKDESDHDEENETAHDTDDEDDDKHDEQVKEPETAPQKVTEEEEKKTEVDEDDSDDEDDKSDDEDEKDDEADEEQKAESEDASTADQAEPEEDDQDSEAATEEKANPDDGAGTRVESGLPAPESTPEESESEDEDEEAAAPVVVEAEKEEPKEAETAESDTEDEAEDTKDDESDDDEEEQKEVTSQAVEDDDEDELPSKVQFIRNRVHIEDILGLDEIGTENDKDETYLVQSTLKDLKKSYESAIKPLEGLYNFKGMSTRVLGDAELFGTPMVLLIGPWSSGKSSIINYLLGVERTPSALKTAPEPTDTKFTVVTYGEKAEIVSGTEMAADWPYSTVQKFGQGFLNHFRGVRMPHRLLQKVTLVDTPGIMETRKQTDKGYPFNEAFQWFIDRADAIYIVFDPAKLEIGGELGAILDQLKGREAQIRFILNKADTIRRSDVMRVTGQLFWNLSPMLGSSEAPVIYTVSLMTKPFHPGSPARFLLEQEKSFLHDIRGIMNKRVENRIAYTRRHAVRVRNHAKMVDCYLATYYRHKSIFSNRKVVAESITENPNQYSIYAGLSALTNVSRYDLPDPDVYKVFFRLNPLYDFKPLTATCSFFKGCPLDKLDIAIAYDLPELLGKYKKRTKIHDEWDEENDR